MNGYGFFRILRALLGIGLLVFLTVATFAWVIWSELAKEANYRSRFGDSWQVEFEKYHGPLSAARTRAALAVVGLVVISSSLFWLYKILQQRSQHRELNRAGRKHRRQSREPWAERSVRYRRNAVLGNCLGASAIIAAVTLVFFRPGIFDDHANEVLLGILMYVVGYCGIVSGCWWLLKAKSWPGAVVCIALAPLALLVIGFVRRMLFSYPNAFFIGTAMVPLILMVVVLVLPDHSRISTKRSRGIRASEPSTPHTD